MRADFASRLTTASTLAELPGSEDSLEISERGKALGDYFRRHPEAPGILLAEGGSFASSISRRYYLDTIGRYLGMDIYHPRPIEFLMRRPEEPGGPLILGADLPIAEAVRLGLERARTQVYEPILVRFERRGPGGPETPPLGHRLVDFEVVLTADSAIAQLRAHQIHQILSTVREGLLLIDRQRCVAPEYAQATEEMLGTSRLAGRPFVDLVAEVSTAEQAELAGAYLDTLFDPRVIENLVRRINPLQRLTTTRAGRHTKVLSFRFARALEAGGVRHVLAQIEDVTRQEALARELAAERRQTDERMDLAMALLRSEPAAVVPLLARAAELSGGVAALLPADDGGPIARETIDALAREVHAAKGESSLLGLARLTDALHGLEEPLAAVRKDAACDSGRAAELRSRAQLVRQVATEACRILDQFALRAGGGSSGGGMVAVSTPTTPPRRPPPQRLQAFLEATERFTRELASQLGRPARFVSRIDDDALVSEHDELLREVPPQLVRNSLVHGVEAAAERQSLGKPATATVQFVARARGTRVEWVFQDDGAGLDLERLRARAAEAGVAVAPGADPATLAFLPGVSTARTIDRHAGRGVGLDLVRERVESHGGRVRIHSAPARFCAVQIVLPLALGVPA